MRKNFPCIWSKSRSCNKGLFEDTENVFIIGSCDLSRKEYIDEISDLIREYKLNPIFAEELDENNNLDAFCENICANVRGSRFIINDISAPVKVWCQEHEISDLNPSLNVYWEYGYAAGLGKQQIVICEEEQLERLPFDVGSKHIQKYNKSNLKDVLRALIESELKNPPIINKAVEISNVNGKYMAFLNIKGITNTVKFFDQLNLKYAGELEFLIKILPSSAVDLFDESRYLALKEELRKHTYGPNSTSDICKRIFGSVKPRRNGFYSEMGDLLKSTGMGGNLYVLEQGLVLFKWFYNDFRPYRTERRLPTFYMSCFILGLFDFLYILFSNCNFFEEVEVIFTIDKLHEWKYTPISEEFPVDYFYTTYNEYFDPFKFKFKIKDLSLKKVRLDQTKKIMRQVLLEMEYGEDFNYHPEILKEYAG